MFRSFSATLLIGLALLTLAGCNQPKWDTPVFAYQSYSRAIRRGEAKLAYQNLSAATRAELEARSKQIAAASGGAVKDDPVLMGLMTGVKPSEIELIELLKVDGDAAIIEITSEGKKTEQRMVKEGEGWKVDLSEAFKK